MRIQLDDTEVLACAVVDDEIEAELVHVERLRAIDVRDGDDHKFESPVHRQPPPYRRDLRTPPVALLSRTQKVAALIGGRRVSIEPASPATGCRREGSRADVPHIVDDVDG